MPEGVGKKRGGHVIFIDIENGGGGCQRKIAGVWQ